MEGLKFLQSSPIIVKIVEAPHDPTGLSGVMIAALGITGVLVALAVVFGVVVGGLLCWMRSRHPLSH